MLNSLGDAKIKDAWWWRTNQRTQSDIWDCTEDSLPETQATGSHYPRVSYSRCSDDKRSVREKKADSHERKKERERENGKDSVKKQHHVSLNPNNLASFLSTRENVSKIWSVISWIQWSVHLLVYRRRASVWLLVSGKTMRVLPFRSKNGQWEFPTRIYICVQISVPLDENSRLRYNSDLSCFFTRKFI